MNKKPAYVNIHDYNYILPDHRIAKFPLEERDSSMLLYYKDGNTESRIFRELPDILSDGFHLVFNDSKVIHARLSFAKSSGAVIEIFLLEPYFPGEYNLSFSSNRECVWKCLVGNAKKWKSDFLEKEIIHNNTKILLHAEKTRHQSNFYFIRFSWGNPELSFSEIIELAGQTPIPPYLNREAIESDSVRYQTVYSENEGSVAAPTAGLHFTEEVLRKLKNGGCTQTKLTLHVGAGTFVPVKTNNAVEHEMHTEHIYLSRNSLESLHLSKKPIIAVGTTSVRALESIFHIGAILNKDLNYNNELFQDQWDAYQTEGCFTRKESLSGLLDYMIKKKTDNIKISTRIMIAPGYQFRMTDGMITNFHQPNSTLLLLIAAFIGEDWKKIYDYALNNNFRFLSYGDCSLLIK